MNDRELIEAILVGDSEAFAALVDRHKSLILRMALRRESNSRLRGANADDVFSRVCLKLWEHDCKPLRTWYLSGRGEFAAYLTGIFGNLFEDLVDEGNRFPEPIGDRGDDVLLPDQRPGPEANAYLAQIRQFILECWTRLPERARGLVSLHYLENLSQRELGEVFRIRPGAAGTALFRAVELLRDCLRKKMGDQPWIF